MRGETIFFTGRPRGRSESIPGWGGRSSGAWWGRRHWPARRRRRSMTHWWSWRWSPRRTLRRRRSARRWRTAGWRSHTLGWHWPSRRRWARGRSHALRLHWRSHRSTRRWRVTVSARSGRTRGHSSWWRRCHPLLGHPIRSKRPWGRTTYSSGWARRCRAAHLLTRRAWWHPLSGVRRTWRTSHSLTGRTSHSLTGRTTHPTGRPLSRRILNELHPLLVAERTATEGRSIFHQMPKESSLHSRISFPNDNDLRLNDDHFTLVFPQGMSDRVQPGSNVIALGVQSNLCSWAKNGCGG